MFNFLKNSRLFSKVVVPFYIPISNVWRLRFLHILASTCFCLPIFYLFFNQLLFNPTQHPDLSLEYRNC